MAAFPDPFESFAAEHRLQLKADELVLAPRDVAASPEELGRQFLITIFGPRDDVGSVRLIFSIDSSPEHPPATRDVLWWLASDAWAVEKSNHDYRRWITMHGYDDDVSSLRAFRLHEQQSNALAGLLGIQPYRELIALHDQQVAAKPRR